MAPDWNRDGLVIEPALVVTAIVSSGVGALMGAAGANIGLRGRIVAIEHELWGVRGENGLKASVAIAHERIDRALERERHDMRRIDARNKMQHPDHSSEEE